MLRQVYSVSYHQNLSLASHYYPNSEPFITLHTQSFVKNQYIKYFIDSHS